MSDPVTQPRGPLDRVLRRNRPAAWQWFIAASLPLGLCGASYQLWQELAHRSLSSTFAREILIWKQDQTLTWDLTVVDDFIYDLPYTTPCLLEAEVSRRLTLDSNQFTTELRLECEDTLIFDTRDRPRDGEDSGTCHLWQNPSRIRDIYHYEIACTRWAQASDTEVLRIDMPQDATHLRIGTESEVVLFLAKHEGQSRPALRPSVLETTLKSSRFPSVAIVATATENLKGVPLDPGETCLIQVDDIWSGPGCWIRMECEAEHDPTYDEGECDIVNGTLRHARLQTEGRDPATLEVNLETNEGALTVENKRIPLALSTPEVLDSCAPGFLQARDHRKGIDACLLFQIPLPDTPSLRGECEQFREEGWLGFSWEPESNTASYRCPRGGQLREQSGRRFCRWEAPVLPDNISELSCDDLQEHLGYIWELNP